MKIQLIVAFTLMSLVACAGYQTSGEKLPSTDAKEFWSYITQTNPYKSWGHFPSYDGIYPGKSPHGAYLRLYANPAALKAAREGRSMPDGAIIVKENYGKDKSTLMAVTPMYRVKGYNPEGGDWFWGKYGPDGTVMAAGKPKGCIECHGTQKSNDWLFTKTK